MPGDAAKAETIGEKESSSNDEVVALGAPPVRRFVSLVPVRGEPLTDEERFPSQSNYYGD